MIVKNPASTYLQGLYQAFGQDIARTNDWDYVTRMFYRLIHRRLPISGLSLSLYDPSSDKYKFVSRYGDSGMWRRSVPCSLESMRSLTGERDKPSNVVVCRGSKQSSQQEHSHICLFLLAENTPTAVLRLLLPQGYTLQSTQEGFLEEFGSELAYLFDYLRLKDWAREHTDSVQSEQDRIAQHLHDTLGDNLAYLHLKLDQLSEETTFKEIPQIHQELERLRDVASMSYQQVRSTLIELRGDVTIDLTSAIHECAQTIGKRADFRVHISSQGEPQDLPPHIQRKVLYVLREALRNVERHALASQVILSLVWDQNCLTITAQDDGEGFDFNTAINLRGHYGLNMIEEMAEELEGDLSIESSLGKGTKLVLQLPLKGN